MSMLFLTVSPSWWNHTMPAEELPYLSAAGVLLGGAHVVNKNIAQTAMGVLMHAVPSAFLPEIGRGS